MLSSPSVISFNKNFRKLFNFPKCWTNHSSNAMKNKSHPYSCTLYLSQCQSCSMFFHLLEFFFFWNINFISHNVARSAHTTLSYIYIYIEREREATFVSLWKFSSISSIWLTKIVDQFENIFDVKWWLKCKIDPLISFIFCHFSPLSFSFVISIV